MYLGIICGWDEKSFAYVQSKGLKAVEFCANDKYNSAELLSQAQLIKGYCEKYGVKVGSVGRWGMKRIDENGAALPEAMAHDKNLITFAGLVGCPVYNVGCNYSEKLSYAENCSAAVEYFRQLIDFAADKGVKIAVYNCDWENFVHNEAAWREVLTALPELGIKYDASHCINRKGDYLKELRDWGKRVYHVHIKGILIVDGEPYDDPPAGLDSIDWGGLFSLLYINDYNGMLSIEPHSGLWKGAKGQWGVDFTIKYISRFIMPENYAESMNPYMP